MRVTLLFVLAVLTGCVSTPEALPIPTGTFWGYTVDTRPGELTLLVATDYGVCENAREAHMKREPAIPTLCRSLTLAPGSDFWIVRAVNLPADGYWGARSRDRCEGEIERLKSRDPSPSTRVCQPVRVDFR